MNAWRVVLVVAVVLGALEANAAEVSRGGGSQTGDGSTPFTGLAQAPEANLFVGAALDSVGSDRYWFMGGATHYLDDLHTFGHMIPGTSLLRGRLGAPFRMLVHQTFGGEVVLRDSLNQNRMDFLLNMRSTAGI